MRRWLPSLTRHDVPLRTLREREPDEKFARGVRDEMRFIIAGLISSAARSGEIVPFPSAEVSNSGSLTRTALSPHPVYLRGCHGLADRGISSRTAGVWAPNMHDS